MFSVYHIRSEVCNYYISFVWVFVTLGEFSPFPLLGRFAGLIKISTKLLRSSGA